MPNDDRPKRSWRDIDKMRDGSSSRSASSGHPKHDPQPDRQQKQYRAALEALFNKGGVGKIAEKLGPPPGRSLPVNVVGDEEGEMVQTGDEHNVHEGQGESAEGSLAGAASPGTAAPVAGPGVARKKPPADDRLLLRRKVVEAAGRQEITKAAEKFLEKFPLPDDHEFLEQLLEHEQESRAQEAMERIGRLLDRNQPPRRSRALCGKLRYLSETSGNEELKQKAAGLLKRLG